MASELWAETVALSDGWTEHQAMVSRRHVAVAVGEFDSIEAC